MRITEYDVRTVDEHGDAQNVSNYKTEAEAITAADRAMDMGALAVVVEKHEQWTPPASRGDRYSIVRLFGDMDAMSFGGWNKT